MANSSPKAGYVPPWATITIAFLAIVAYLTMTAFLFFDRGQNDTNWARAVSLFTGIQAVAFSAFGWALGTQVGQGAVNVAKEQTARAQTQVEAKQNQLTEAVADRATHEAEATNQLEKGQRLARMMRDARQADAEAVGEGAGSAPTQDAVVLLAKALYPEVFDETGQG